MKKLIFLIFLMFLTGCSVQNINEMTVDEIISTTFQNPTEKVNTYSLGYKFYLPKGYRIKENNLYNVVLISNGKNYYLNIDLVSYFNKEHNKYSTNDNSYYYKEFTNGQNSGYVDIKEMNDNKFYINILYNYGSIETIVKKSSVNSSIKNSLNILSSLTFNDIVIKNKLGNDIFSQKSKTYEIEKPNTKTEDKDFLDFVEEYGEYKKTTDRDVDDGYIKK